MQRGTVLRHDSHAAVVVTEVLQLFVSITGAVDTACLDRGTLDTAYGAYLTAFGAVDTAFLEPGTEDTAFGAWTANS